MKYLKEILAIIDEHSHQKFPILKPEERQSLLEVYHPDNSPRGKEELTFGPNKGQLLPKELLNIMLKTYNYPMVMEEDETDLLVIGSGGAGISAALEAVSKKVKVMLVTKDKVGASNTVLARGGMAVALGTEDLPSIHIEDTLKAGNSNNVKLVDVMTREALNIVPWLEKMGMDFDKVDENKYRLIAGAGHSQKRVMTYKGFIGPRLMKTLINALRNSRVNVVPFNQSVELICEENQCLGAVVYDRLKHEYKKIWAKAVVLTTGGLGGLNPLGFPTCNHGSICGEGLAIAYKSGVKLIDMDSSQFHPTGALWPEPIKGMLISEGVRSLGASLYNALGKQFVNPLEIRDVVTAAIIKEIIEERGIKLPQGEMGIIMNSYALPEEALRKSLGNIYTKLLRHGYNPQTTPIIVGPTYHYQNGGLAIDDNGRTTIKGLWAAGEVTGGIHGKNRLGGNALTDALVFGRRAGYDAAQMI